MNVFYLPDAQIGTISFPEEESKHIVKVLRMKEGDRFCVTNGKGSLFDAVLIDAYPKALEYINQSAALGGLDALEFLIQAYRRGDARFGIKADEAKATEYFNKLIRSDCNLKKIRYFREYLASLKSKKDKTKDDLIPLFRSIGRNPQADRIYSDLLYSGDKAFGIEKNVEHAMRMLHFAARGPFIRSAVDEIIRHYEQDINRSVTQDELQLNQEMMKLYQTIR